MRCLCVQWFIYLTWILYKTVAQDLTLSGNGTAGANVSQGSALTMTCSVSQNVTGVLWYKTESTNGYERRITATGLLPDGSCIYDPAPPAGLTCSCVSNSNSMCTIQLVTVEDHGDNWRCSAFGTFKYSSYLIINVNVPVSSVTLTPDLDSISVIAGTSTQLLKCTTSSGIPTPTVKWFKNSGVPGATSIDITSQSSSTPNQTGTISTLFLTPSKGDHGWRVYCRAENLGYTVTSARTPTLNVLYDPSVPECTYRGQKETGPIRIIQGITFMISCNSDGNPTPEYTWIYPAGAFTGQNLTINSIQTSNSGSFTVQARNTMIPTGSTTGVSQTTTSTIPVDVLYGPSIPTFRLGNTIVTGTIKIISGNNRTIRCSSQSNPTPIYTWTPGGSGNPELVLTNVQHPAIYGLYTCKVETTMVPTRDTSQTEEQSGAVTIEVLYPPSTPEFHYSSIDGPIITGNVLAVVQGESPPVFCVSRANPNVSSYLWSGPGGSASQQLVINSIIDNSTSTCNATNTMVETCGSGANCGETKIGTKQDNLIVIVWKPPVTPSITYQPRCNTTVSISVLQTLKVIEGDSFCLRCFSTSSPGPTYSWSGQVSLSTAIVSTTNITRNSVKLNTCRAENIMITTFNGTVVRSKEASVNLDVLYAPRVEVMADRQVVKGEPFSYECPFTPGNPVSTTFAWTSSETTKVWNSRDLTIPSIQRSDDSIYTCTASNELRPTDGTASQQGRHSGQFHLEVLYGAENMTFYTDHFPGRTSVNVSENTSVAMTCTLESNPGSKLKIIKSGQVIHATTNTKMLSYRTYGKCDDAGIYTCMGQNQYPGSQLQSIDLTVLCSPRHASEDVSKNVRIKQHDTATLKLAIQAYPAPTHRWAKCSNGTCSGIQSSTKFNVSSDGLIAHLTVVNVEHADFGQYQLTALNGVGNFTQLFWLIPSDKPDIPKNFSYVPSSVTHTSVTLTWIPGFNGGPTQTFHIQYKKSSENTWNTQSLQEADKPTLMNITLANLNPATQYDARMNATNAVGSSNYTETFTILTLEEDEPRKSVLAAIIGGTFAGVAIVCIVCCVVWIIRKYNITLNVSKKGTDQHSRMYEQTAMGDLSSKSQYDDLVCNQRVVEGSTSIYVNTTSIQSGSPYESLGVCCESAEYSCLQVDESSSIVHTETRKPPTVNKNDEGYATYMNTTLKTDAA